MLWLPQSLVQQMRCVGCVRVFAQRSTTGLHQRRRPAVATTRLANTHRTSRARALKTQTKTKCCKTASSWGHQQHVLQSDGRAQSKTVREYRTSRRFGHAPGRDHDLGAGIRLGLAQRTQATAVREIVREVASYARRSTGVCRYGHGNLDLLKRAECSHQGNANVP